MAVLKCKMCGGNLEINNNESFATCESCGSTTTLPKSNDERIINLFNRANHYRRQNEFDKALATYENILEEDNNNAEAFWGCVLSKYGIEYVEDNKTGKRIPTCHRVQNESILADLDYLNAIKYAPDTFSKELYQAEAEKISQIQKDILNIARNEKPYDIFICYKETDENGKRTKDSTFAQDIYFQLTNEGKKVFFSRITLEDKLGHEYEPYIFAALNSAKVMLVIGTKSDYFNSVWVKNEWARFLEIAKKDKSRLIIPCYRDMDAYELPEELSMFQSQDMGKIGFIQDLIRGINKVFTPKTEMPNAATSAFSSTQPVHDYGAEAESMLKRAFLFLEDAEWKKANELLEKVLNINPENTQAYIGKLMVDVKVSKEENLAKRALELDKNQHYTKAIRFADSSTRARLEAYSASAAQKYKQLEEERINRENIEKQQKAEQQALNDYILNLTNQTKKDIKKYRIPYILTTLVVGMISFFLAIPLINTDTTVLSGIVLMLVCPALCLYSIIMGLTSISKLNDYDMTNVDKKDTARYKESLSLSMETQKNKIYSTIKRFSLVAIIITVALNIVLLSIQPIQYNNAMKLYENGDYDAAVEAFDKLDFYKDSYDMKKISQEKAENIIKETNRQNSIQSGKIIKMGNYNGKNLEWDVIGQANGKKLLLCRESFKEIPYDEVNSITTWEISNIRNWCKTFYNQAFSSSEKNRIILSTLQNIDFDGNKGPTEDYVFALSYDEASVYLPNLTDEARNNMEVTETDAFWLRTISNNRYPKYSDINYRLSYPYIVWGEHRGIDDDNYYAIIRGHVRPAMWINEN